MNPYGSAVIRPKCLLSASRVPFDAAASSTTSRVGEWSIPWNAKAGAGRLGPGIPKADFWASAKEGIDQVGCVYVGVIVGPDLVYRPMDGGWVGQPKESHDRVVSRGVTTAEFTSFAKSTCRVLLTRGLRACYVYFMDDPTRDFFLNRTERAFDLHRQAEAPTAYIPRGGERMSLQRH